MNGGPRELRLVVTAPDYDAAVAFYRDVLGLTQQAQFDSEHGRAVLLSAGLATVEIGDSGHAEQIDELEVGRRVAGPVRVAFEVADAPAATDALVAAGATLVSQPVRTPWGSVNARLDAPAGLHLTVYSTDVGAGLTRLDGPVVLASADPAWPTIAASLCSGISEALGSDALLVEHVGSTSIPGMPAKPIIDLVLAVADSADESSYLQTLERIGYRLRHREPEWHEHRLLKRGDVAVNLHVFSLGSVEVERMLAFRDHLRADRRDHDLYLATKQELAAHDWAVVQDYADAKTAVVTDVLSRALARPVSLAGVFVVVSGPPGSGKSTLALDLAPRLGLPLIAKDTVKEALMAELEVPDVAASQAVGRASVGAVLALAAESGGAVLEGPWHRSRAKAFAALPGRLVEVFCRIDREAAEPLDGEWPVLEVDTSAPVDGALVARQVGQLAGRSA